MANTQSPFGFTQVGTASGPPNFARAGSGSPYKIKSTFTTAIFFGDPVRMWVSGDSATSAAGYITPWLNGDGAGSALKILVGIFLGCEYLSASQKKTVWNNYYPGSDASGDVSAYVCDDPNSQWMVQAGATPIDYTPIGANVDVSSTASSSLGSTITGISGQAVATPTTTVTLPFKVVNIVVSPSGVNGRDDTTGYNNVIVAFNNQIYKAGLGV